MSPNELSVFPVPPESLPPLSMSCINIYLFHEVKILEHSLEPQTILSASLYRSLHLLIQSWKLTNFSWDWPHSLPQLLKVHQVGSQYLWLGQQHQAPNQAPLLSLSPQINSAENFKPGTRPSHDCLAYSRNPPPTLSPPNVLRILLVKKKQIYK